jgi:uncharacterized protein YjbI with pentapeptide repeats
MNQRFLAAYASANGSIVEVAEIFGADLDQAVMSRSKFSEANLGWANLSSPDLSEAELRKSRYNQQAIWSAGFSP